MGKRIRKSRTARPLKTITGKSIVTKALKPQRARFTIRRFHTLHKKRAFLVSKLDKCKKFEFSTEALNTDNYKDAIKSDSRLWKIYKDKCMSEGELSRGDVDLSRAELASVEELLKWLGNVDAEERRLGGLQAYQLASTVGQGSSRGGDSSKKLLDWLQDQAGSYHTKLHANLRALEIGCLSPYNAISTSKIFKEVVKIDLNSQHPQIKAQDFMKMPIPQTESDKFDVISCSLVLNFVPSAQARGEMLKRITKFLSPPSPDSPSALFLVLPSPCVNNSRYTDHSHLTSLMESLGFHQAYYEETSKLAYWLLDWETKTSMENVKFSKKQLHQGGKRNNFAIALD